MLLLYVVVDSTISMYYVEYQYLMDIDDILLLFANRLKTKSGYLIRATILN